MDEMVEQKETVLKQQKTVSSEVVDDNDIVDEYIQNNVLTEEQKIKKIENFYIQ